jgi:hypothetical protein
MGSAGLSKLEKGGYKGVWMTSAENLDAEALLERLEAASA